MNESGGGIPEIELLQGGSNNLYRQLLIQQMKVYLKKESFLSGEMGISCWLEGSLPFFDQSIVKKDPPYQMAFVVLCHFRRNAFKFFFEMISRWMVPGKLLNVVSFFATDFRFPELGDEVYTFAEIQICVDTLEELNVISDQLKSMHTEICLGLDSAYYARRILEVKGLAADEKTAMIQEHIANLIERRPKDFDQDVFGEMQHVMVRCPDEFKAIREARHMARIICVMYLFRKELQERVESHASERHLFVKLVRARLTFKNKESRVVGVFVGLNFLRRTEIFDQRHLLKAISGLISGVEAVENSFLFINRTSESLGTLYLEVRKIGDNEFAIEELRRLKKDLAADLKNRIEQLMHPVFMPRNEEEVMRNILSLSGQLKYVRDIPQVMINFEEQTSSTLVFTIVWLRVVKPGEKGLRERFVESETSLVYRHDRCRTVGILRKRYAKEATVFRVSLSKECFLRGDHSIDLYRARRFVAEELTRILGEFRDYNGGMISKQEELLTTLRTQLSEVGCRNELILENFFYSLTPVIMRSVLPVEPLKELFFMILDESKKVESDQKKPNICVRRLSGFFVVTVLLENSSLKELLDFEISKLNLAPLDLTTASIGIHGTLLVGYVLRSDDVSKQTEFYNSISSVLSPDSNRSDFSKAITSEV